MIPRLCSLPLILLAAAALLGPAAAQEPETTAPAARPESPAINYRERPGYSFDPQRLKRRPTLDGVISFNEWDSLYTATGGPVSGTVYVNWDEEFLYLAAQTAQPSWVIFNLDTSSDGWLKGADNVELTVAPVSAEGKPPLTARLLDGRGKDTPVWDETSTDVKSIQLVSKPAGSGQVVELAVPRGFAGFVPRPAATLGFRADFLPADAAPTPTPPYEPHLLLEIRLVEAQVQAAQGFQPRLVLEDNRVIPGQTLKATLEIQNQTEDMARLRAVSWKGEAAAGDLLRSVREVNLPAIPAGKPIRLRYSSVIPEDAPPGAYQITATAELEGGRSVAGTAAFTVVEPFSLTLPDDGEPVKIANQTRLKIPVDIYSAVPGYARGEIEIEAPGGWVVEGRKRKPFEVGREDRGSPEVFYVILPPGTPSGDYQVHVNLTWRGKSWRATRTLKVVRSGEGQPAAGGTRGTP